MMNNIEYNNANIRDDDNDDEIEIIRIVDGSNASQSDDDFSAIQDFKHRDHSLGISASNVAACAGYHEFQSIPELMIRHVYQGRGGQRLLEHDAKLLGLELISPEDDEAELLRIANSTGSATVLNAVTRALKVKHGDHKEQQKVRSIGDAQSLKKAVSKMDSESKKRLTPHQLRILEEGTRQAVDTGCGNFWEEEALDRYQEQCGWEVRERNAECRLWHFEKVDSDGDREDWDGNSGNAINVPSIQPIAPAQSLPRRTQNRISTNSNDRSIEQHSYDSRGVKRKEPSSYDSQMSEIALKDFALTNGSDLHPANRTAKNNEEEGEGMKAIEGSSADKIENATVADICINDEEDNLLPQSHKRHLTQNKTLKPFVTIKGMVDGVRDELGPKTWPGERENKNKTNIESKSAATSDDDDDDLSCDSFCLSRVVVECKHRMNKLLPNGPRFSECIQAVVYCFMYEADDADIIQVLRTKTPKIENKNCNQASNEHSGPLLTDYYKQPSPNGNSKNIEEATIESNSKKSNSSSSMIVGNAINDNKEAAVTDKRECKNQKDDIGSDVTMKIGVDRVSLDDPQFGHRANWKNVILPKLRQWVDAVYRIRKSDDKRYRLLTAVSMMASHSSAIESDEKELLQQNRRNYVKAAWELIFEECDFLRDGLSGERYRIETQ